MSNPLRSQIVAAARSWIGTPYVHQAATKGAGCDCLGLVRGVWREVMGTEPETPPPYTRDWAERSGRETLKEAAFRHMDAVPADRAGPGDVLLFAFRPGLPAKHCAILTTPIEDPAPRIIHAHEHLPVAEVALVPGWRRKIRFAFCFRDLSSQAHRPSGCLADGADHQVRRAVALAAQDAPTHPASADPVPMAPQGQAAAAPNGAPHPEGSPKGELPVRTE